MKVKLSLAAAAVVGIAMLAVTMKHSAIQESSASSKGIHVVLIGASIGQAWHLAEWPSRTKTIGFTAESIPAWQFDKSEALDEVLMRPRRKFRPTRTYLKSLFQAPPQKANVVILKECSSYFPGDLAAYEDSIRNWVDRLREKQITIALATVVPVTETRAQQNPGKQESLVQYNDWVRQYAQQQGLILVDLELALRSPGSGRFLREEFAVRDGTHLNAAAYVMLDNLLRETLLGAKSLAAQVAH